MLRSATLLTSFLRKSQCGLRTAFIPSFSLSKDGIALASRSSIYNHCATFHTSATVLNDHSQVFKLINKQIEQIVPEDGSVAFINSSGKFKPQASFKTILAGLDTSAKCLIVASYRDGVPTVREISLDSPMAKQRGIAGAGPSTITEVAAAGGPAAAMESKTNGLEEKEDRKLKAKLEKQAIKWKANNKEAPKRHIISWSIATADLQGKKRKDIENALAKGCKVEIFIGDKKDIMLNRDLRSRTKLEPLERERRELLVDQIKTISEEIGIISKKPSGNIFSKYSLVISPAIPDYVTKA